MKRTSLLTPSDHLTGRRLISFAAVWIIALVSLFVPDLTWLQIPSFVDFMLLVGGGMSVILSFTLLTRSREFSIAQPLALMCSSLTAAAAMATFVSLRHVNTTRVGLLSICMAWQLLATFLELRLIVERGEANIAQRTQ